MATSKDSTSSQLSLSCSPAEQWRPVVGYEGLYAISSRGRVKSLDRTIIRRLYKEGMKQKELAHMFGVFLRRFNSFAHG